jgi:hypothetical protein
VSLRDAWGMKFGIRDHREGTSLTFSFAILPVLVAVSKSYGTLRQRWQSGGDATVRIDRAALTPSAMSFSGNRRHVTQKNSSQALRLLTSIFKVAKSILQRISLLLTHRDESFTRFCCYMSKLLLRTPSIPPHNSISFCGR